MIICVICTKYGKARNRSVTQRTVNKSSNRSIRCESTVTETAARSIVDGVGVIVLQGGTTKSTARTERRLHSHHLHHLHVLHLLPLQLLAMHVVGIHALHHHLCRAHHVIHLHVCQVAVQDLELEVIRRGDVAELEAADVGAGAVEQWIRSRGRSQRQGVVVAHDLVLLHTHQSEIVVVVAHDLVLCLNSPLDIRMLVGVAEVGDLASSCICP